MRRLLMLLLILAGFAGCDAAARKGAAPEPEQDAAPMKQAAAGAFGPKQLAAPPAAGQPASRKIIYTGHVDLIVTDFDSARQQVVSLVETSGGYVANFNVDANTGDRRHATYTVRVPVAKFQSTLDAVAQLGHVVTTRTDSQDVTDEFYDLDARLKTKQEEEKALRELLAKSVGKLDDVLTMRRELKQIREEIESMQGRLNKLSKLAELTTINVTLLERKDYTPPTAPSFAGRAVELFSDSAGALWNFLKGVALAIVAIAPWLPLLLAVCIPAYIAVRRARRPAMLVTPIEPTTPPSSEPPAS